MASLQQSGELRTKEEGVELIQAKLERRLHEAKGNYGQLVHENEWLNVFLGSFELNLLRRVSISMANKGVWDSLSTEQRNGLIEAGITIVLKGNVALFERRVAAS